MNTRIPTACVTAMLCLVSVGSLALADETPAKPLADGDFKIGPPYKDAPELTVKDDVLKGTLHEFTVTSEESKIYPGLKGAYKRKVAVYVPKQYKEGATAPFIVVQDGLSYTGTLTKILDNLIHERRLPAMVAIFINSGGGDGKGSERGLEYDTLSEKYAVFVEKEVLPRVEKECKVTLTRDPKLRAAMGGSSGGAAAFTMAWYRPDLYRRVLCYSGTFVDQQSPKSDDTPHGAWEYHENLIPKTDAKPLRVWLQVGEKDNGYQRDEASLHNWVLANERMAAALKAKDYHYRYVFSAGAGHVDRKVVNQTLPEALLWLWQDTSGAADPAPEVSAERVKAAVEYLASDRLEGRGPGTRGEILATEYLADEFKKAGLKPIGERGTYYQPVPLVRIVTSPKATLRAVKGETTLDIPCEEGFSGTCQTQKELEEFDAEAVFVGHGITAPEFDWDDYKGVDVKGKIVILFTNEPPSDDPKFFGGAALTYYGRWTYKFEEAARRGAKACFIIHTKETAGYPYAVVRPLEGAQLKRDPDQPALAFAGWISSEMGEKLLGLSGRTVAGALKEADTKGFKAYSLGVSLKGSIPSRVEKFTSNNVVGLAEGSDPAAKSEAVRIASRAHWDHLGIGRAVLGDSIYNGAADNATGCALLVELARAWCAQSPRPKRSALFLAVTAEEKGLLGSKFYTEHPLIPLGKTALALNFDMILPLGVPESVVVNGAERTTAWPLVKAAAEKNGLEIEADRRAHLGTFFRSDHFSLARAGVPAFSVAQGMKIKGKAKDFAIKAMQEFNDKAYHSPQDEVRPEWDFSGFAVLGRFSLEVSRDAANAERLPTWVPGDEFRPARRRKSGG